MFRPAGRFLLRSVARPTLLPRPATTTTTTRSLFTTVTKKKSSLKSTAVRWILAGGIAYWYATSNVFADEPTFFEREPSTSSPDDDDDDRPPSLLPKHSLGSRRGILNHSGTRDNHLVNTSNTNSTKNREPSLHEETGGSHALATHPKDPEELEEEAGQEGAFNPETGEINWDCPCLGGMAHGPCGEEFKTAFSCFVFSTEEPKGVDCIDKFKGMQTCFQKHPEVYGSELDSDEDEDEDELDTSEPDELDNPTVPSSPPSTRSQGRPDTATRPNDSVTISRGEPEAQTKYGPDTAASPTDGAALGSTHGSSNPHTTRETELEGESKHSLNPPKSTALEMDGTRGKTRNDPNP